MTDSVPQKPPFEDRDAASAAQEPATAAESSSAAAAPLRGGFSPWLVIAVLALGLAGWQWLETRDSLFETRQEVAKRLSDSDAATGESRTLVRLMQEQLTSMQGKVAELEGRLAESKSQQEVLETLYKNLARGREDSLLAETEQGITLAAQQLQLAGNVQGAVLALQTADARLSGSNRPQFIALRKVIDADLERLRALPQLDMPGMYVRLENVIGAIDGLPLAVGGRPRAEDKDAPTAKTVTAKVAADNAAEAEERKDALPAAPVGAAQSGAATAASANFLAPDYWRGLAGALWSELRGLVRIQRFDREEPALLAPGQGFFLRENLKLRLLNARLALLSRDRWTYRNELEQARVWIGRYFDGRAPAVRSSLQNLQQLIDTEINIALPSLNESLSAIKSLRAEKERQ